MPLGFHVDKIANTMASKFNESGIILYLKSIADRARSVKKLKPIKRDSIFTPCLLAILKKTKAEKNSIKGYCIEIFDLQKEHFPLKKIHDRRGMLCQNFNGVLQSKQCEGMNTILSSFGILKITTFKNEPNTRPNIVNMDISIT
jgi:hypothetical protein